MAEATNSTQPGKKPAARDLGIEALRGLAIVLMVIGHVIGVAGGAGLEVADNSVWRKFYVAIDPLAMPMFALISGYVYAMRPATLAKLPVFFKKKFQRIVVPLVWVSVLTYAVRRYALGIVEVEWTGVWRLWVFMYDHFWFLHVLLIMFAWVAIVDALGLMNRFTFWVAWLAGWLVLSEFSPSLATIDPKLVLLFSLPTLWSIAPLFVLGVGLKRFELLRQRQVVAGMLVAAAVLMAVYQWRLWTTDLSTLAYVNEYGRGSDLGLATGMLACWALVAWRVGWWPLVWVGQYAYSIYLFHLFGTAGTRVALEKIGIHDVPTHLIAGTAAGLLLPVTVHHVVKRFKWLGVA